MYFKIVKLASFAGISFVNFHKTVNCLERPCNYSLLIHTEILYQTHTLLIKETCSSLEISIIFQFPNKDASILEIFALLHNNSEKLKVGLSFSYLLYRLYQSGL